MCGEDGWMGGCCNECSHSLKTDRKDYLRIIGMMNAMI